MYSPFLEQRFLSVHPVRNKTMQLLVCGNMFSDLFFSVLHGPCLVYRNFTFIEGEVYVCCCKSNPLEAANCAGANIFFLYFVWNIWNISIEKYFMYVIITIYRIWIFILDMGGLSYEGNKREQLRILRMMYVRSFLGVNLRDRVANRKARL